MAPDTLPCLFPLRHTTDILVTHGTAKVNHKAKLRYACLATSIAVETMENLVRFQNEIIPWHVEMVLSHMQLPCINDGESICIAQCLRAYPSLCITSQACQHLSHAFANVLCDIAINIQFNAKQIISDCDILQFWPESVPIRSFDHESTLL